MIMNNDEVEGMDDLLNRFMCVMMDMNDHIFTTLQQFQIKNAMIAFAAIALVHEGLAEEIRNSELGIDH